MYKAYKYKLQPNKTLTEMLNQHLGSARFVYNYFLAYKKKHYEESKTKLSYVDTAKLLTKLKQQEEYVWLNETSIEALQQSLKHLDAAFTNFYRNLKKGNKPGYPKFKSRHQHTDSATYTSSNIDFNTFKVQIPKIGWVKICKNKIFDTDLKHTLMTITRDACGDYWCSILVETNACNKPTKAKLDCKRTLGLDLGLKTFITDSQGNKVDNPRFLEKSTKHLAKLQRKISKKTKGSKRRETMRLKVARVQRKIKNQRLDFLHKLTTTLSRKYDAICIETLDIQGMLEKGICSKSILSASWNTFVQLLDYKCKEQGCHLIKIDRFYASSQLCSHCGYKNTEVKNLKVRSWKCPICGAEHDRDINAAINILNQGLMQID